MYTQRLTLGSALLFVVLAITPACFAGIPDFEMNKKPLAPEDPSLVLAGIGGVGLSLAYLRSKFRK